MTFDIVTISFMLSAGAVFTAFIIQRRSIFKFDSTNILKHVSRRPHKAGK